MTVCVYFVCPFFYLRGIVDPINHGPGVVGNDDIIMTFALAHMFLASNFQVSLLIDQSFKLGTCTF